MNDGKQPGQDTTVAETATMELDEFLPYRLAVLAEEVSRSFSQIYAARFGISVAEWRVVALMGQRAPVTAKLIVEHSTMHKTKVSRAVAALEKRGYLERDPNPDDMRESFLKLTPSGQRMYSDLVPQAQAFNAMLQDTLTADQKEAFDVIVAKLTNCSRSFCG